MTLNNREIPFKLLIVEDHEFTRTGLKYSFQGQKGLEVIGEAGDGLAAMASVEEKQPDIILMDIGMPQMDGITATQKIKAEHPEIKVIMLTSRQLREEVYATLAAGADAYCMKDITTERLIHVIETVMDGAVWLDPTIARIVASALPLPNPSKSGSQKRQAYNIDLTEREREVLNYIAQGKANKEIADTMSLSIHTVKTHVRSLIQKLAVDDRTQAALKAVQEGLI